MAFEIRQPIRGIETDYDREADVLYVSFGPPRPAVGLQIEDWLVIRLASYEPWIAGVTIIGARRFVDQLLKYEEKVKRSMEGKLIPLKGITLLGRYDEIADVAAFHWVEPTAAGPVYYESLAPGIDLEKTVVANEVVGFRVDRYSKNLRRAMDKIVGFMLDEIRNVGPLKRRKRDRRKAGDLEILTARLAATLNRSQAVGAVLQR